MTLITDPMGRLADLLTFGVIGTAAPVPAQPLPEQADWLTLDTSAKPSQMPTISAPLRAVVQAGEAPLADPACLGALAWLNSQRKLPAQVVVSLPYQADAPADLRFVARPLRKRLRSAALMLHEQRRQRLGLSARLDRAEISAAIHAAFVLPAAQAQLRAALPTGTVLHITDTPAPPRAKVSGFAPLAAQPGDALSGNAFALAIRTGYFGPERSALRALFRLTPGQFGGALRRTGRATPQDLRIALAIPQFQLFPHLLPREVSHA